MAVRATIDHLKGIALNDRQIEKMSGAKMLLYKDLLNYDTLETLLDHNGGKVIILYISPVDDNFGHFTALLKTHIEKGRQLKECVEWMDSYGYKPDAELAFSSRDPKHGQEFAYLSKLMIESPYILTYNEHKFQEKGPLINSCGWWCSARLRLSSLTLKEFKRYIRDTIRENKEIKNSDDAIICIMYDSYKTVKDL